MAYQTPANVFTRPLELRLLVFLLGVVRTCTVDLETSSVTEVVGPNESYWNEMNDIMLH
jgi:hypothetical protein